jgi:hypothetical protein
MQRFLMMTSIIESSQTFSCQPVNSNPLPLSKTTPLPIWKPYRCQATNRHKPSLSDGDRLLFCQLTFQILYHI